MTANRSNWLQRAATIVILVALLIPMFFGGVRSVQAASTIYVDDSWIGVTPGTDPDEAGPATNFGTDSFATIQEAVDAAVDGDTVQVFAGTYVEQVTISQDITLITTEDAVIKAFPTMPQDCTSPSLADNHPIICVNNSATVTIDGFTVDGDLKGDTNLKLLGIAYRNAGGIIQNNTIVNIRPPTVSSTAGGVGIYVYNTDTALRTVTIVSNLLHDFNENGISITTSFNSGNRTEFLIDGNTIEGIVGDSGIYNSTVPQNGIQVRVPLGGGIIQGNTISKIAFNNNGKSPFVGVSILSISTPVDAKNNIITGAQAGIVYFNDLEDVGNYREISGNQIEVIKPGTSNNPGQSIYGVLVTDRPIDVLSPIDSPALGALNAVLMGSPLSVVVKDNVIKYVGSLPNTKTFGIEIDAGYFDNMLTVDILNNQIGATNDGFDVGLAFSRCDSDNLPLWAASCGTGELEVSHVARNNISGNNYGVFAIGPILSGTLDDFHHNRIAGNGIGVQDNTSAYIGFANNWWGCNNGPVDPACDSLINSTLELASPWLKLNTTANPTAVPVGGTSILTADLKFNSAAENTSLGGFYVWDGIPVTFSVATLGSINPLSGNTLLGAAQTTFTAPMFGGTFQVCATVDNETVCSDVTEDQPLMIFLPLISK